MEKRLQKTLYFSPEKLEQLKREAKNLDMSVTQLILFRVFSNSKASEVTANVT